MGGLSPNSQKQANDPAHIIHQFGDWKYFANRLFSLRLCVSVVNELRF